MSNPVFTADKGARGPGPTVCILASFPESLVIFRGALISEMRRRGARVIACAPQATEKVRGKVTELGAEFGEIFLNRTGMNPAADVRTVVSIRRALKNLRPDLVLSYTAKPVIYGSIAARLASVPRVYSIITGLGFAFVSENRMRSVIGPVMEALYRLALRKNDAVFFQNPDDLAVFERKKLLASGTRRVVINGSGVDTAAFPYRTPRADRVSFLMIARLYKEKGVREFVEAARALRKKHPQAAFRLVGPADSNPSAISAQEADGWRREGIVEHVGWIEDVRPEIERSSVYVLPSYGEGTPRSVLEAMSMGRPVVTTDVNGCRETVVHGKNGYLVPARDAAALASAMEYFIQNPASIVPMGLSSRAIAEEKYEVSKVNQHLLSELGL